VSIQENAIELQDIINM